MRRASCAAWAIRELCYIFIWFAKVYFTKVYFTMFYIFWRFGAHQDCCIHVKLSRQLVALGDSNSILPQHSKRVLSNRTSKMLVSRSDMTRRARIFNHQEICCCFKQRSSVQIHWLIYIYSPFSESFIIILKNAQFRWFLQLCIIMVLLTKYSYFGCSYLIYIPSLNDWSV